jgi:hypothetical protein
MRSVARTVLVLLLGTSAWAMWMRPTAMPVDRLIENLNQRVSEAPSDAALHLLLGRVHSYAFVFRSRVAPAYGEDPTGTSSVVNIVGSEKFAQELPEEERKLEADDAAGKLGDWQKPRLQTLRDAREKGPVTEEELLAHLAAGVSEHLAAVNLRTDLAAMHLGLAYLLEQGAPLADKLDVDPLAPPKVAGDAPPQPAQDTPQPPAARAAAWSARAEAEYLRAFDLDSGQVLTQNERPSGPGGFRDAVSYEAALGALRLMDSRPAQPADNARRTELKAFLARVAELPPPNWVTPIVFSLDDARPLDALLSERAVVFDLDGNGRAERWPWLQPDTALLVWDPDATGQITSGVQLFGSATWWLLPGDGYQALDLIDDDGDGWLAGAELAGLAVWQDRNGDGVSGPGEVMPIESTEIEALATHATGAVGRSLVSEHGLRLRGGRLLPTYDWVTAPTAEP